MKGWSGLVGWPCSRRFTHIIGHLSAAGRAQDSESSPVTDWRSTTVPRNHLRNILNIKPKQNDNKVNINSYVYDIDSQ